MLSFTEEGGGRRAATNERGNDGQIEMSDVSSTSVTFNSFPENLRDDENASILENDVNANVEEQIRAEEEAEERANNGNAGRRNVQIDPLVAAGIDQAEELIPNRSVPLGTLLRSDSFMTVLYSIVLVSTLGIALLVDRDHSCTTDAPPLRTWAVVQLILQCVSFVVNYKCVRIYVADPEAAVQKLIFKITILLSRVIHVLWFISFIVGAVYTFKFSNSPCKYELPYLYTICTAITYFNLFVVIFFLFSFCCCCCLLYVRIRLHDHYTQTQVAVPAEETVIQALPTAEFKEGLMDPSDARCAICLCDYEEGEKIRYLPCHHHFHLECIDTWLITNKNCPFCKHPVDTPLGEDEKDNEFLSHNTIPQSASSGNESDLINANEDENENDTENNGGGVAVVDDDADEKDEKDEVKSNEVK